MMLMHPPLQAAKVDRILDFLQEPKALSDVDLASKVGPGPPQTTRACSLSDSTTCVVEACVTIHVPRQGRLLCAFHPIHCPLPLPHPLTHTQEASKKEKGKAKRERAATKKEKEKAKKDKVGGREGG